MTKKRLHLINFCYILALRSFHLDISSQTPEEIERKLKKNNSSRRKFAENGTQM